MEKKYAFEGQLTKDPHGGPYYLAGIPLFPGQVIELKIKGNWKECVVDYVEGTYFMMGVDLDVTYGVARLDIRHYVLNPGVFRLQSTNYPILVDALNKENVRLNSVEFKSLLLAMDMITMYGVSKPFAIKYVAVRHKVTQKFIREWLSKMNLASQQELESRKALAKQRQYEKQSMKWI